MKERDGITAAGWDISSQSYCQEENVRFLPWTALPAIKERRLANPRVGLHGDSRLQGPKSYPATYERRDRVTGFESKCILSPTPTIKIFLNEGLLSKDSLGLWNWRQGSPAIIFAKIIKHSRVPEISCKQTTKHLCEALLFGNLKAILPINHCVKLAFATNLHFGFVAKY